MVKPIMIQGTMSNAGKSVVTAGLCRIFMQDGFLCAPFKSQNMALNSYITSDGLEMGRAQVMQAEAAGIEPSVLMNPVLLKPTGDMGSQVIVNGEVLGTMDAAAYFEFRPQLRSLIMAAYSELASLYDIIVIEGAGSPAEINLNKDDIVNMGMAEMAGAPVIIVADIDRGGVFASVYGTIALLKENERSRVRGIIINKFRGDLKILKPGLKMLEELTNVPVLGVIPYLSLDIDDEDSLSDRFKAKKTGENPLDIAVIHLPHVSNFTDFNALSRMPPVGLRYVDSAEDLKTPDLIIIPGTKNTMNDLLWLRKIGLEAAIKKRSSAGIPVIGICGGYQMLGSVLDDPEGIELEKGGNLRGMELLPVSTVYENEKVRTRVSGKTLLFDDEFAGLSLTEIEGYEIHMGRTVLLEGAKPFSLLSNGNYDGAVCGNVFGSYLHGLFDGGLGTALIKMLIRKKGIESVWEDLISTDRHKDLQYNILADAMRSSLDMPQIYKILGEGIA